MQHERTSVRLGGPAMDPGLLRMIIDSSPAPACRASLYLPARVFSSQKIVLRYIPKTIPIEYV